ncbi:MAG: T9SS type A sorting domain-containing protein [Flavobacteriaceae bacterium]|nr:T9SS type A sorting domain-containing protein [Psychroflexus sp.]
MKKITLALALFTFGVQAQNFPSPYCDIDDGTTVEEITSVEFAETSITNTDASSILIDETSTTANVAIGETYTITVEGNTNGNSDNNIVAFIDWNQNEVLDDANEIYEVGTLTNSDGEDGTSVSLEITVPADAELGTTRIRITKTYTDDDSIALIDPCAIEMDLQGMGAFLSYGQALDFTLDIEESNDGAFPSPYCDIDDDGTTTEEITAIEFAETSITNTTDAISILIDETSTVADVAVGETYTITVEGNTYGDFDNNIVAFIDWNQNGILDDANEIYEVGTLTNSDGEDGTSVSLEITVPADAELGTTRIRVTKTYTDADSIAEINPCAIEMDIQGMGAYPGYGQAIDFTLDIGTLGAESFDKNALSAYPVPTQDILNIEYKSVLNAVKIYNNLGQEVFAQNTDATELQLDLSTLTPGAYIVKLFAEKGQHSLRIIKQ